MPTLHIIQPPIPCQHRGRLLHVIEPPGCGCKVRIYQCHNPAVPQDTCYKRRSKWFEGHQSHARCLGCPHRES